MREREGFWDWSFEHLQGISWKVRFMENLINIISVCDFKCLMEKFLLYVLSCGLHTALFCFYFMCCLTAFSECTTLNTKSQWWFLSPFLQIYIFSRTPKYINRSCHLNWGYIWYWYIINTQLRLVAAVVIATKWLVKL